MPDPTVPAPAGTDHLDHALAELRAGAGSWAAAPADLRIGMLERLLPRIRETAAAMVADACRHKGHRPDSPWASEDWAGGPWALAQHTAARLHGLRRLAAGRDPLPADRVHETDGRTWVDVFPATAADRLLLAGYRARVRLLPGTSAEQARERAAARHRHGTARPGIALVLGAGNVAALTATDILHQLYAENRVVIAKLNPVNAYLRPHYERIFAEFVRNGWLRLVDGGPAEGALLTTHPEVDAVHITGSARTHDAVVWGTDDRAEQRRRTGIPLVDKPLTSELGGVSPFLVVPGPWSAADFRHQAEHIVTAKMNNSGHNCIAAQVLLVPRQWDGAERLLDAVRAVLRDLPFRTDYYPGSAQRLAAVRKAHPGAEMYGDGCRLLVPDVADPADPLLTEEVFASALGVVRLPGDTPAAFLDQAVRFANDRLPGTLGATVLVHPRTERDHPAAVAGAVDRLRYGTIAVNTWSGVGFLLGHTPWGAHPGHTRQDIGSGTGFVNNTWMLDDVEKTVLRAPFAPAPRGLFTGSPSLAPRPPHFVTHRSGRATLERLAHYTAAPAARRLPGLLASALRG
ncbi:aldehyde dehydrogenase family protein [Kitasatospora arboriphila]|uniref:Aldehyde dehydrogenase family protein n=1 Tax=Kitasatospora arboriphila TaxID=258052 RepID=A0ABN1TFA8_9ACTN